MGSKQKTGYRLPREPEVVVNGQPLNASQCSVVRIAIARYRSSLEKAEVQGIAIVNYKNSLDEVLNLMKPEEERG